MRRALGCASVSAARSVCVRVRQRRVRERSMRYKPVAGMLSREIAPVSPRESSSDCCPNHHLIAARIIIRRLTHTLAVCFAMHRTRERSVPRTLTGNAEPLKEPSEEPAKEPSKEPAKEPSEEPSKEPAIAPVYLSCSAIRHGRSLNIPKDRCKIRGPQNADRDMSISIC